jgi:rhamnosyl/mannosyltransferase
MRVLQLGKFYEPVVGGIETHLSLLSEGLAASGVHVEVLVHHTERVTARETVRGIPVTRVGSLGRLLSANLSPGLIRELSRPFDILHLHVPHPMGMLAYVMSRKPRHALVVTHHSDIVKQARTRAALKPLFRSVMTRADAVISTSERYLSSSAELGPYRAKARVIPYGIDLSAFTPALRESPKAREIRARHGGPLILAAGRLIYYKGFEVLLDAMKTVRGHLLLVGDGPLRQKLTARARRNGIDDRVTFVGNVPNAEMGGYYGAADVFVLPSVARSEAFGIVQIEAMASGLPVVNTALASGVPGVSLNGATGLTVEPNDPSALGKALTGLLDAPDVRARFAAAARERAMEFFTSRRMVAETLDLYRSLVTVPEPRIPSVRTA